jgi:hypothetical protein
VFLGGGMRKIVRKRTVNPAAAGRFLRKTGPQVSAGLLKKSVFLLDGSY